MISVHKFLGILARNKKYANFLIMERHGDRASLFKKKYVQFKNLLLFTERERVAINISTNNKYKKDRRITLKFKMIGMEKLKMIKMCLII